MRLRIRLAGTVLAAALPLAAGAEWLRADVRVRLQEDVLREFALARMENGGRELCERAPERFPPQRPGRRPPQGEFSAWRRFGPGGPGRRGRRRADDGRDLRRGPDRARGPRGGAPPHPAGVATVFWAYSDDLESRNPAAPPLPEELAQALRAGAEVASRAVDSPAGRVAREAVVRMPWSESPCAFVLVRREWPRAAYDDALWWGSVGLVAGGVLVAVLLAMGPVVARVRRLTESVRESAESSYGTEVEVRGDDEIGELARAFNEAGAEVREHVAATEQRERTLRTFVADTTHDVMTPLTVLQGYLDELRVAAESEGSVPREALRGAMEEAQYTTSLIHNLSAAAKLDAAAGGIERHPVDLCRLVHRVVARHRPVARERSVELEFAVPAETLIVPGDDTLLEQAVSNVVHNAVRYNASGGHVAVVLRAAPAGEFELSVVDDGPGVPPEELARLTQRSFRGGEARTRSPSGTGIGLHIAGDVCARHGIALSFAPSPHGGLAVTFRGASRPSEYRSWPDGEIVPTA